MNFAIRMILSLSLLSLLPNCATNQQTRFALAGTGAAVGTAIGVSTAPEDEKKSFHGPAWAGWIALVGVLIGELFFNDSKEKKRIQKEYNEFKSKYDFVEVDSKHGYIPDPENPGKKKKVLWRIHKGTKWFEESPTKRYKAETYITTENADKSKSKNKSKEKEDKKSK